MRFLSVLIMFAAGFFVSIQGPVNTRLRVAVESPVLSATISFLSGGLVLLCIMATDAFGGTGAGLRGMQSAPLRDYLGGALARHHLRSRLNCRHTGGWRRRCHLRSGSGPDGGLLPD
jgi:uncharacterized membrane protein YdcZ (DUF606 family)